MSEDSNVIPIQPVGSEPDENLIAELELLLRAARAGELTGIAFIGLLPQREFRWGFIGRETMDEQSRLYVQLDLLKKMVLDGMMHPKK